MRARGPEQIIVLIWSRICFINRGWGLGDILMPYRTTSSHDRAMVSPKGPEGAIQRAHRHIEIACFPVGWNMTISRGSTQMTIPAPGQNSAPEHRFRRCRRCVFESPAEAPKCRPRRSAPMVQNADLGLPCDGISPRQSRRAARRRALARRRAASQSIACFMAG